jgi:hypothetical protein
LRLFFEIHGYLAFGNFWQFINISESREFFVFYDPYTNFGTLSSFPLPSIEYYVINAGIIGIPSTALGLEIGAKIYIFITSLIFGLSFYFFTSIFTKKYFAKIFGTLFFLFNPFTIQLYASGDFSEFVFQSFILIGALFLHFAILKRKFFHPYYLISVILLLLSFVVLQAFLAGLILYFFITIYTITFSLNFNIKGRLNNFLKSISAFIVPFLVLGIIIFLPIILGPVSYLPGSSSSLPLGTFMGSALNIFKVITLEAYPPPLSWISVLNSFGVIFYNFWFWLEVIFIFIILISYAFIKDRRLLFFSVIAIILSLFASETAGPLAPLTVYLYLHFPGYQALNYPYLWVWFLIMPIYSILVTIICSKFNFKNTSEANYEKNTSSKKTPKNGLVKQIRAGKKSRTTQYVFLVIIVFVLISPITTQGYYGSNGIQKANLPSWFNSLDATLVNLTHKNNSGVVFNTIGSFFQFGNNSNGGLNELLQMYPQYRTTFISSYIPNYNTVTNFYYWFYYTLYNNETKYSAQLLSSLGVQYFVDIYNANSEGYPYFVPWSYDVNTSSVLVHQSGWERIVRTQNYSIFKNQYFNGNDYYTSNLSLVLGDYNTLNDMAYLGMNLNNVTPVFPSDLTNPEKTSQILNKTNLVVLDGNNSIYDLILNIANSTNLYPVNLVNGELGDRSTAWINGQRNGNYPFYGSLLPYTETSGNNSLNVPVTVSKTGNYDIFVKAAFSNISSIKGGIMNILSNGKIIRTFNTSKSYENETNSLLWIKLIANLSSGKNVITLQSQTGFNAVSEISVVNKSNLQKATNQTDNFLSKERNNILQINEPDQVAPTNNKGFFYGSNLGSKFPGGNYLHMSGSNGNDGFSIHTPHSFNGTLSIEMLSQSYSVFNISYGNRSINIGISPNLYVPSNDMATGSILLPVQNVTSLTVNITKGYTFIGLISLLPENFSYASPQVDYSSLGNLTYKGIQRGISNFTLSENADQNLTTFKASFSYKNISAYFPVSLNFAGRYDYNMSPIFTSSVMGPGQISLNGVTILSEHFSGQPIISPSLSDQSNGRPTSFNVNFVPKFFHSNVSYNVSFTIKFYGFSVFPEKLMSYLSNNHPGPQISYTAAGYKMDSSRRGILVIRFPFIPSFLSNAHVNTADNGLNTLMYSSEVASVNGLRAITVTSYVYNLFWNSFYIGLAYSLIYIFVYYSLSYRARHWGHKT